MITVNWMTQFLDSFGVFFLCVANVKHYNLRGCVWHAKLTKLANHSFTVEKLCLMVVNYIIVNDDNLYFTYVNHG